MTNLFFCGLPMCGKSVIGKEVAATLGREHVDLDRLIEEACYPLTCREIYLKEGEAQFRKREKKAVERVAKLEKTVISLGGGTLNDSHNRALVKGSGKVIYLKEEPEILWQRVFMKGIPAYLDPKNPQKAYFALAVKRTPVYESVADRIIPINNRLVDEIVREVLCGI